jgi:hypothetical protein
MATITWIRPSGTEIQTANTKEMKAFAKANKWKKKTEPDLSIGDDNGNSEPSSESNSPGSISPAE